MYKAQQENAKKEFFDRRERERETLDFPFFQSDDDDDKNSRDVITNVSSSGRVKENPIYVI